MEPQQKTALILTGGGARAAHHVGGLQAISELLGHPGRNPFPIICGTSAGAINAASLACYADHFAEAVGALHRIWSNFHVGQVYRADALGIGLSSLNWLSAFVFGWLVKHSPRSLLDNTPLRHLLEQNLDFSGIDKAIERGNLFAVSITASGYLSGNSISFFQARPEVEIWKRTHRAGAKVKIGVDHLLASSAIPFIFPAIKVNREFFGDGSMRQLAPVSPAIHLGAERILVIGAGRIADERERMRSDVYPSFAQIAGHAMSSIFLDSLHVDLESLQRINNTVSIIPEDAREKAGLPLRRIETLVIMPSQRIDYMAARHFDSLPWAVRALLRGIGATGKNGSALTSYLIFEKPFTCALIELGYTDTMSRRDEVCAFLGVQ
jgi:NTE family protein